MKKNLLATLAFFIVLLTGKEALAVVRTVTITANTAWNSLKWSPGGAGSAVAGDDLTINYNGSSTVSVTGIHSACPSSGSFNSLTLAGTGTGTITLSGSTSTIWTLQLVCNANVTLSSCSFTNASMTSTSSSVAASQNIKLINALGQIVFETEDAARVKENGIDVSKLSAGLYTLQIRLTDGVVTKEVVVK